MSTSATLSARCDIAVVITDRTPFCHSRVGGNLSFRNPNPSPLNLKHSQLSCDRSSVNLWRSLINEPVAIVDEVKTLAVAGRSLIDEPVAIAIAPQTIQTIPSRTHWRNAFKVWLRPSI